MATAGHVQENSPTASKGVSMAEQGEINQPLLGGGGRAAEWRYGVDRVWTEAGWKIPDIFNMFQDRNISDYQRLGQLEGIARKLNVNLDIGLSSQEVASRSMSVEQGGFGENYIPPEEPITYWKFLKEALEDKMMILLLVLGAIAIVIDETVAKPGEKIDHAKEWIEGGMIIIAVTIVVLFTTINDWRKELKFQALNVETSKMALNVLRDGQSVKVDVKELVVGDVVNFTGGLQVPADGILIRGQEVVCDEAAITGESDTIKKHPRGAEKRCNPFMISGTSVIAAEDARFLCVAVGEHSRSGHMEIMTRTSTPPTPLQEKLDDLANLVGNLGIGVALMLFFTLSAVALGKWADQGIKPQGVDFLEYAILGVAIVVVAVPEGLPLSVTIALAYSMQAMMKDNCMVRSLAACETMGAATNICSDKTGTLTTNQMTTMEALVQERQWSRRSETEVKGKEGLDLIMKSISFNSTATDNGGNKTDQGLVRWMTHVGYDYQAVRASAGRDDIKMFPFMSAKKRMTTIVRQEGQMTQYTKGASEVILQNSSHYLGKDGGQHEMGSETRKIIERAISDYARNGLRTIGVAMRVCGSSTGSANDWDNFEEDPFGPNLTWLGVCGIQDPVRAEVPSAIELCKVAGVTVRMCTGDNIDTARSIGRQCGIYTDGSQGGPKGWCEEGPKFRKLFVDDEEEFMRKLPSLQVLARCSPEDKQLMVGGLMRLGHVVAVTGDGTNDAPALKLADVGFAMDDGTDVAKKASKIVLLDNNFVSVVKACKWGRNVNDNIRKFLQFQFTVNIVLLVITFVGAVTDAAKGGVGASPLASIHLLWCNLIMDTFAALALSTEKPHDGLMLRPPTFRSAPLMGRKMWRFILGNAVFQMAVMLTLIFHGHVLFKVDIDGPDGGWSPRDEEPDGPKDHAETKNRTVMFNVFVYMQVFNWFNARKLYDELNIFEGMKRSTIFVFVVLFTAAFQATMVEVFTSFMQTQHIGADRWAACIGISAMVWPFGFVIRSIPMPEPTPPIEPPTGEKLERITKVQELVRSNFAPKGDDDEEADRDTSLKTAGPPIDAAEQWRKAAKMVMMQQSAVRALRGGRGDPNSGLRRSMAASYATADAYLSGISAGTPNTGSAAAASGLRS